MTPPPPTPGKPSGFRTLLGYYAVEWTEGYARLEQPLDERHMNSMGRVHGGLYATLVDAALGHAVTWCRRPGHVRFCVTVSLTTTYLEGTDGGTLYAIGRLEGVETLANGRLAVGRAEIVDQDGRKLAVGQGSFLYLPGSESLDGVPKKRG